MKKLKRLPFSLAGSIAGLVWGEELPTVGGRIEAPGKWIDPTKRGRILFRRYEKEETLLLDRHLRSDLPVVELGAGIGYVSQNICRRLASGTAYLGVEGIPELAEVASRNVERIPSMAQRFVRQGVYGSSQEMNVNAENFHFSQAAITSTDPLTLLELLSELGVAEGEQYQLVTDIEGGEWNLLDLDTDALKRCCVLIAELHGRNGQLTDRTQIDDLASRLSDIGFVQIDRIGQAFAFTRPVMRA